MRNIKNLIAVVKLKTPVSMWDVFKTAAEIKNELFKEPDNWSLIDCSYNEFQFKLKETEDE